MFCIRDNVFSSKNAISKNVVKKTSYLPNIGFLNSSNTFYKISSHFTLMTLSPSSESTTHLGHYGLIAGVFVKAG
jgi:hypothetical protein